MDPTQAVNALLSLGLTERVIGDLVGAHQSQVHRISKGAHPRYALGLALVQLAGKHVKRTTRNRKKV
ncbi:MAG: hypothetical protein ACOH2M_27135 [Cypionkella sp.]